MYYHVFIADTCNLLIGSVVLLNPPHAFDPPTHVRPGRAEALATLLELETLEQQGRRGSKAPGAVRSGSEWFGRVEDWHSWALMMSIRWGSCV